MIVIAVTKPILLHVMTCIRNVIKLFATARAALCIDRQVDGRTDGNRQNIKKTRFSQKLSNFDDPTDDL